MKTRNKVIIGGAVVVIAYLLWDRNKKKSNLTASNVSSGAESTTPTNESSNLDLPSGMDLPNLTPSTNVPTEVAIEKSIKLKPLPAIVDTELFTPQILAVESASVTSNVGSGGGGGGAIYLEDDGRYRFDDRYNRIEQQMY